jgi:hypothetical protein
MMYNAGLRTVTDVAKVSPKELVEIVKLVSYSQAKTIISAAKYSVLEKYCTAFDLASELSEVINDSETKELEQNDQEN